MKISVIGAGSVGVGVCSFLLNLGSLKELMIFDINREKAEGEAWDFIHTQSLTFSKNTKITVGTDYSDFTGSDIIVLTAGAQIKVGQSRMELNEINGKIGVDIMRQVEPHAPDAVVIVVTNPCDIVAHSIIKHTGYAPSKVISSGCVVDTARLMSIVAGRVDLDPKNIFGYVLGEHGSLCFIPMSLVSIAGQSADYYCDSNGIGRIDPDELLDSVKSAGLEIFRRKMNTTHGIAASVFRIIQAISINERSILPVGVMLQGEYGVEDVVLSVPAVIGQNGVERILEHPFGDEEMAKLKEIALEMRSHIPVLNI
ncbi:MAG: hypothetical protein PQJ50_15860 [Spirochaetales bacterium]|nr:hypothetical protein [Spirochaetales bacterium]